MRQLITALGCQFNLDSVDGIGLQLAGGAGFIFIVDHLEDTGLLHGGITGDGGDDLADIRTFLQGRQGNGDRTGIRL